MSKDELRRLAEAATSGEWSVDGFNMSGVMSRPHGSESVSDWKTLANCQTANWKADAAYIAAASPDVVLSLLDRLDRAENRRDFSWLSDLTTDELEYAIALLAPREIEVLRRFLFPVTVQGEKP